MTTKGPIVCFIITPCFTTRVVDLHTEHKPSWSFGCDCDGSPQCLPLSIEHCLFGGLSISSLIWKWKSPTKPWRSRISVLSFFKLNPRVSLESLCRKWISLTTAKEKTFPVTCHRQISMNPSFFLLRQMRSRNTMMKWAQEWSTCMNGLLCSFHFLYISQALAHLQQSYQLQQKAKLWRWVPVSKQQAWAHLQHQVSAPPLTQQQHLTLLLRQPVSNSDKSFSMNGFETQSLECLVMPAPTFVLILEKEMRENELGCWGECQRACLWKSSANPRYLQIIVKNSYVQVVALNGSQWGQGVILAVYGFLMRFLYLKAFWKAKQMWMLLSERIYEKTGKFV